MGVYIPDVTVDMLRKAPIKAVKELLNSGELIDVKKPHGDLIDRSELELDTKWDDRDVWYTAYSQAQISDTPVIIEAEGVPRKWWEPKCEVTNG